MSDDNKNKIDMTKEFTEKTEKKKSNTIKANEKSKISSEKNTNFLEDLKKKLKDTEDKLLRELAENDNLRKRHEKEISDSHKFAVKNFSLDILNVTDNFQRALHSIPRDDLENSVVLKNLVIGIESLEKEMHVILERYGIKSFSSLGEKFNPEVHQAMTYKSDKNESGKIIEEMQKGYMIADRLLRPAMVVVSKGPEKKEKNKS